MNKCGKNCLKNTGMQISVNLIIVIKYYKICKSFLKNNVNNEGKIDNSLSKGNFRHKYHK